MLRENIGISLRNIRANGFRSFLTMLGVIIGVTAIITLMSLLQSITVTVQKSVAQLGVNRINLTYRGLTKEQALEYATLDNIAGVSASVSGGKVDVLAGESGLIVKASLVGRGTAFITYSSNILRSGTNFTEFDIENENYVCILGYDIAQEIFFGQDCIGQEVVINFIPYTVIGVTNPAGDFALSPYSGWVIVPFTTLLQVRPTSAIDAVELFMINEKLVDTTISDIDLLSAAFKGSRSGYTITNSEDLLELMDTAVEILSTTLIIVTAIALFVGGIGIMNMMLVNIRERTVEIGLRKALGATSANISQQFLIESMVLSMLGAIIGTLAGIALTLICAYLIGCEVIIELPTLFLAIAFSLATGVIFGFAPAGIAGRLKPIDALRS